MPLYVGSAASAATGHGPSHSSKASLPDWAQTRTCADVVRVLHDIAAGKRHMKQVHNNC